MGLFFNDILLDDLFRYEGERCHDLKVKFKYVLGVPGFTYIFFFRHASQAKNVLSRAFWSFFLHLTKFITHIQIPAGTRIGRGLRIVHFGHIVINPDAEIGENFNISQGCLIGNAQGRRGGVPIIGDNV